jgi:hypothetical protein
MPASINRLLRSYDESGPRINRRMVSNQHKSLNRIPQFYKMVGFRHFRLVGWERLGQPELRAKVSWRSFSSKLVKDITEIVINNNLKVYAS